MKDPASRTEGLLPLQRDTFGYFLHQTNPANGLVADNTRTGSPCSITAVGLALASYPVGVQNGFLSRQDAVERVLTTLRFFRSSHQGYEIDACGCHGFYYHFLDMADGRRANDSELSTVDSSFLLGGALTAAVFFDQDTSGEREIRDTAEDLYRRADWQWALHGGPTVAHGGTPEQGFLSHRYQGYDETLLLHVLGLGSPTYPLPPSAYHAWTETFRWRRLYGIEYLYAGPLFIHQLSHCWIDFRGIADKYMRAKGMDYFENSRRATLVQQRHAAANPDGFRGYDRWCWGVTASDGPGPATVVIDGRERTFYDYVARGIPDGPDDGTLAPWAVVASLPFAPDIVLPTIERLDRDHPEMIGKYGFKCSFNPTFQAESNQGKGWVSQGYYGLDQGPVVLMIENYHSGLVWELVRRSPHIRRGLARAGFRDGWLAG